MASSLYPSDSSTSITSCEVRNCLVNSITNSDATFFPLPQDPVRRQLWLRRISREELNDAHEMYVFYICHQHFRDEDIIVAPQRNFLKSNVDPSMRLPPATRGEVGLQVQPWQFDKVIQTEPRSSQMVCQKGPAVITELRRKRKIQEEYDALIERIKMYESETDKRYMELFKHTSKDFLSDPLAELIKPIVYRNSKYSSAYKIFCLNLYHISPQAYRLLSEDFNLPPVYKLKEINPPMTTEINEDIMAAFGIKVRNMTDTEKYCSVAADVMKLKYNLSYCEKQDKILGFHEIDGFQTPIPARYAVILLVRGILVDWTQPIGFAFLSATKCSEMREEVSKWIDRIILELCEIGLKVKTFACTAKSKLLSEANIRSISVDKPYFTINDVKIYYVYDFPHMFRELRNYFMTHNFHFTKGKTKHVAKFQDIKDFYELDKARELRIATKLTESHISPSAEEKRQTRFATELLSNAVAVGMNTFIQFNAMPESARDTVKFVKTVNNLYEIFNYSVLSPSTFREHDTQIAFLKISLQFFQSLKLVNSTTGQEIPYNLRFIKGLQITIKSVLLLFKELQQDESKHLLIARLNLSATENFIKKIKTKGKKLILPTSQRFTFKFQRLFVAFIIKSQNEGGVSEDLSKVIVKLSEMGEAKNDFNGKSEESTSRDAASIFLFLDKDDCSILNSNKDNPLSEDKLQAIANMSAAADSYSFCDILLKKCLELHNCQAFELYVKSFELMYNVTEDTTEVELVKADPTPIANLLDYIAVLEDKFREVFESCRTSIDLVSSIYESCQTLKNTYCPCRCFPVEFFQKLFIKTRVYMAVNYNNRSYREHGEAEKTFVIPGL